MFTIYNKQYAVIRSENIGNVCGRVEKRNSYTVKIFCDNKLQLPSLKFVTIKMALQATSLQANHLSMPEGH